MYENLNLLDISSDNAHEYLAKIKIDEFIEMLDSANGMMNRQSFCTFLGIRESTLSGWLKSKKLPHYAQMAFGLLVVHKKLQASNPTQGEVITINMGSQWGLARLTEKPGGEIQGQVIASGIESESTARQMMSSMGQSKAFVEALPDIIDTLDNSLGGTLLDGYEDTPSSSFKKIDPSIYKEEDATTTFQAQAFALYINSNNALNFNKFELGTLILLTCKSEKLLSGDRTPALIDNIIARILQAARKESYQPLQMIFRDKLLPLSPTQNEQLISGLEENLADLIKKEDLNSVWEIIKQGFEEGAFDSMGNLDRKNNNEPYIQLDPAHKNLLIEQLSIFADNHQEYIKEGKTDYNEIKSIWNLGTLYLTEEQMKGF